MGTNQKPEVTEEELKAAQSMWHNFTEYSKYSIIAICISLALLGLALL